MRPHFYQGLLKFCIWMGCLFVFLWTPYCLAETILDTQSPLGFIREHAGIIITVLLVLLIVILLLLVKSRRLQKALWEKNQILINASQTITSYFDVVDKNILSISLDLNGIITYVSSCFIQRYHYQKHDLIGKPYQILFNENNGATLQSLSQAITHKNDWEGELLLMVNDEGSVWAEISLDVVMSEQDGEPNGYTLIFNDITNQKLIRHISETDSLTGIYNRYRIDTILDHELNRQKRYCHNLAVGMIDLDYFKPINDTHGHLVGDDVLIKFVEIIKSNIRKVDIFGRWGGEEFIIIFPETNLDQAYQTCEKLRKAIIDSEFPQGVSLTASFGITECEEDDSIDAIIHRADQALYQAKKNGRNCTKIAD
ncbi:diguanylate cyclase [Legionella sp. W05-934-2]|jgi:diguanylate cyclase (GGDEF)-like protein/PAS domain S-box-containing protein|uniref:sensor domain-containing diguanylate cyclase n=1 Tax=Legionella sp. W05-934-2 TaxID=1198649 RepID=UPI00346318E7